MPRYLTIWENGEQFGCYRAGCVELAETESVDVAAVAPVEVAVVGRGAGAVELVSDQPFKAHARDGSQLVVCVFAAHA